jgi:hypothetical protein
MSAKVLICPECKVVEKVPLSFFDEKKCENCNSYYDRVKNTWCKK